MKKPKLNNIDKMFLLGKEFSLTESQYYKETEACLPKDFYYLKNKSALARLAKKHGYNISIKEKTILFEKENKNEKN